MEGCKSKAVRKDAGVIAWSCGDCDFDYCEECIKAYYKLKEDVPRFAKTVKHFSHKCELQFRENGKERYAPCIFNITRKGCKS